MSNEKRSNVEFLQELFNHEMKTLMAKSGFKVENTEFATKDGITTGLVDKEVFNVLKAQYPNSTIKRLVTGRSNAEVFLMTHKGGEQIVRVTYEKTFDESYTRFILTEISSRTPAASSPRPPLNAEFVLHLLLKREEQDAVIGDILERYVKKHARLGEGRANLWFYAEVLRSLWPLLRRAVGKASGLLLLTEWVRRMTH